MHLRSHPSTTLLRHGDYLTSYQAISTVCLAYYKYNEGDNNNNKSSPMSFGKSRVATPHGRKWTRPLRVLAV